MLEKHAILLDANAGAPLHPRVKKALSAFLLSSSPGQAGYLGNPSSGHSLGRAAEFLLNAARSSILKTFQASPEDWQVTFTSGGTEANQLAVRGTLDRALKQQSSGEGPDPHWIVSPVEHSCVRGLIEPMQAAGVRVTLAGIDGDGEVTHPASECQSATLISVIGVNNETGRIQPFISTPTLTSHILSAGNSTEHHPLLHVDLVAGWGKVDLDLSVPGCPDLVAIAAHKLGGLPGVGALIHRKSCGLEPQVIGSQEAGLRGGTENILGILSLKVIADEWISTRAEIEALRAHRDRFEIELKKRLSLAKITAADRSRAPHLSHFSLIGLSRSISIIEQLDLKGFAVAAGSACASQVPEPSHVLLAMGLGATDALNSVRVSLHSESTWEELALFLDALESILKRHDTR
ncbi:MAG: aminotransferase class V-fold PLP-dependent enzyme [Cryobacterium sp.]|nr:aminotransferase class V-fold PLP-dependent enzyme [Oligoflexia bacterium]